MKLTDLQRKAIFAKKEDEERIKRKTAKKTRSLKEWA